jgi:hypothetical protein
MQINACNQLNILLHLPSVQGAYKFTQSDFSPVASTEKMIQGLTTHVDQDFSKLISLFSWLIYIFNFEAVL